MKNKINSAQYGNEPFSPKWPGVPYAEDELLPPFQCRTMKKATLASLYFPDDNVETPSNTCGAGWRIANR